MGERLFGRQVIVEIGVPGQDFRRWEDLTISARVHKGSESSPNTAEIEIKGLKDTSIASAQQDGAAVRLFAGYSVPRLIFAGPINRDGAVLKRHTLSIEAKDGGDRYRAARVNQTFDRGTSFREIFDVLAEQTGLPLGAVDVPAGQLSQDVTLTGRVSDVLDRLALTTGAVWSFQDGELQFLPGGETAPDRALLVSSHPGARNLIGSPQPGKAGMEVRALLDGRFLPGRRISLDSRDYTGVYRIVQVEHLLDSARDQNFYSDLVLRET